MKLFCLLLVMISQFSLYGQCFPHDLEETGSLKTSYRTENVNIVGSICGYDIQNSNNSPYSEDYEFPILSLGFTKSLWVGGKTTNNDVLVSANFYPRPASKDFVAGPYNLDLEKKDFLCNFYNRVWVIKKWEVQLLKYLFENNELKLSDIPIDILEWPAMNNSWIGEASPDYKMAPFFDFNNDQVYNPLDGDYPMVDEDNLNLNPDQYNFSVYNDNSDSRSTNGEHIGLEFHQLNYVFDCGEETSKSIFTRIKYIYKGQQDLFDVKFGVFEDDDIGCYRNKIDLGCDTSMNVTFSYRFGDDGPADCDDIDYPNNFSTIRTSLYKNDILSSMYFNNLPFATDPQTTDPTLDVEFYNYLSGIWLDGTPLTLGGTGYLDGTDETLFAFNNLPNEFDSWTSSNLGFGDYRKITTVISRDLKPNDFGFIEFVDHVLIGDITEGLNLFDSYPNTIQVLKDEITSLENGSFCNDAEVCETKCVWPGDTNDDGKVTFKDIVLAGVSMYQNVITSMPRDIISNEWFPFESEEWNIEIQGVNSSYSDINGNGVINENDIEYLISNLEKVNSSYIEDDPVEIHQNDGKGLNIELYADEFDASTFESLFSRFIESTISLGNTNQEITEPLHSLSFKVKYDSVLVDGVLLGDGIIDQGLFEFQYSDFKETVNNSGIGETIEGNKIQYCFSNLRNENIESGKVLAGLLLLFKRFPETVNIDQRDTFQISIEDIYALNSAGEIVELGSQTVDVRVSNLVYNPDLISSNNEILADESLVKLFPNPINAGEDLNLEFKKSISGTLSILSIDGVLMRSIDLENQSQLEFSTVGLSGMFIILVESKSGERVTEKLFINH